MSMGVINESCKIENRAGLTPSSVSTLTTTYLLQIGELGVEYNKSFQL
jgi:alanine dehydrogenase